jgi:hypothetical protein
MIYATIPFECWSRATPQVLEQLELRGVIEAIFQTSTGSRTGYLDKLKVNKQQLSLYSRMKTF